MNLPVNQQESPFSFRGVGVVTLCLRAALEGLSKFYILIALKISIGEKA
jgi:hypothetical protein